MPTCIMGKARKNEILSPGFFVVVIYKIHIFFDSTGYIQHHKNMVSIVTCTCNTLR